MTNFFAPHYFMFFRIVCILHFEFLHDLDIVNCGQFHLFAGAAVLAADADVKIAAFGAAVQVEAARHEFIGGEEMAVCGAAEFVFRQPEEAREAGAIGLPCLQGLAVEVVDASVHDET